MYLAQFVLEAGILGSFADGYVPYLRTFLEIMLLFPLKITDLSGNERALGNL